MGYDFKTSPYKTHSVTPFSLKYSYLMNTTNDFDSIMKNNQALALSFQDQFIPSMGYTFTYDNSTKKDLKNYMWWQTSVVSAGNILYGVMALCGNKQGNNKTILGKEF